MLTLGLNRKEDKLYYAIVDSGRKVVAKGEVDGKHGEVVSNVCEDCRINPSQIKAAAVHTDEQLDFTDIPLHRLDRRAAEVHSLWVSDLNHHHPPATQKYPQLIWYDDSYLDTSDIVLVKSPSKHKTMLSHNEYSIRELTSKIEEELKISDFFYASRQGDQFFLPVNVAKAGELDMRFLLDEIKDARVRYDENVDSDLEENLRRELLQFWKYDIAASLQEAIFSIIIDSLTLLAQELGVRTIGVVSELVYNERFLNLIANRAKDYGMDLRVPLVHHTQDIAASLAGLAYFYL
ncbi:MAG: hypothetical protein ACE5DX_03300 [Candidatus Dojkabacteria bacterium]